MSRNAKKFIVLLCVLGVIACHMIFGLRGGKILVGNWLPLPGLYILLQSSIISFLVLLLFTRWIVPRKVPPEIITPKVKNKEGAI